VTELKPPILPFVELLTLLIVLFLILTAWLLNAGMKTALKTSNVLNALMDTGSVVTGDVTLANRVTLENTSHTLAVAGLLLSALLVLLAALSTLMVLPLPLVLETELLTLLFVLMPMAVLLTVLVAQVPPARDKPITVPLITAIVPPVMATAPPEIIPLEVTIAPPAIIPLAVVTLVPLYALNAHLVTSFPMELVQLVPLVLMASTLPLFALEAALALIKFALTVLPLMDVPPLFARLFLPVQLASLVGLSNPMDLAQYPIVLFMDAELLPMPLVPSGIRPASLVLVLEPTTRKPCLKTKPTLVLALPSLLSKSLRTSTLRTLRLSW